MNRRSFFFALAVASQLLILAVVPAQKIYTRATGRSVTLKIRPVDPYSILSGYYVTLNYEIASSIPFADSVNAYNGDRVYVTLERQNDGVWRGVSLSKSFPANLPENRIAIRGRYSYSGIEYGIEEFFIPEDKRAEIERELRENNDQARVEIKVDSKGDAALVRLLIGNHIYDY
ncbi:MAG TPA: GDYXXLXY domain-containing protein [Blastocatellia bacterium]|nr:GDYXXLXY domain-containing protein [Blastocatellia bacterium]